MTSLQGLGLCRGANASIGDFIRFLKKGIGGYFSKNVCVALITRYKDIKDFVFKKKQESWNQIFNLLVLTEKLSLEKREHSISGKKCVLKTNFSFCDFYFVWVKFYQLKLAMFLCLNPEISQNFLEAILFQAWDDSKRQASRIPKNL